MKLKCQHAVETKNSGCAMPAIFPRRASHLIKTHSKVHHRIAISQYHTYESYKLSPPHPTFYFGPRTVTSLSPSGVPCAWKESLQNGADFTPSAAMFVGGWDPMNMMFFLQQKMMLKINQILGDKVDGRNPAPVDRWFIPSFLGFHTSQVVQDFSHQQY